ncbi:hypothetical protein [Reticulibacter mediterranei]|nr:hypothetical protein [Reticulibacter mediterranei]
MYRTLMTFHLTYPPFLLGFFHQCALYPTAAAESRGIRWGGDKL